MPDFVTLNPAELTDEQLRRAEITFEGLNPNPPKRWALALTPRQ